MLMRAAEGKLMQVAIFLAEKKQGRKFEFPETGGKKVTKNPT